MYIVPHMHYTKQRAQFVQNHCTLYIRRWHEIFMSEGVPCNHEEKNDLTAAII